MGFGVWGLGFGVWGLGLGVWGLGFGVWGLGFGEFRVRAEGNLQFWDPGVYEIFGRMGSLLGVLLVLSGSGAQGFLAWASFLGVQGCGTCRVVSLGFWGWETRASKVFRVGDSGLATLIATLRGSGL